MTVERKPVAARTVKFVLITPIPGSTIERGSSPRERWDSFVTLRSEPHFRAVLFAAFAGQRFRTSGSGDIYGVDQSSRRVSLGTRRRSASDYLDAGVWALRRRSQLAASSQPAALPRPVLLLPVVLPSVLPWVAMPVLASSKPSAVTPSLAAKALLPSTAQQPTDTDATLQWRSPTAARPLLHAARFTLVIRADQTSWVSIQPTANLWRKNADRAANTSVRASHES